jgi:hypothetical protein
VLDDHLHLARRHVKAHLGDVPRSGDFKDLGVQVAVSHATTVETGATPADSPSGPIHPHGFLKTRFVVSGWHMDPGLDSYRKIRNS